MLTLFTAIWMPDEIRRRLVALQPERGRGVRPVRWDQLHLTLVYVGRAEPEPVAGSLAAVRGAPFEMRLGPTGKFGSPRRRVVLWAGVEPDPRLLDLQAGIAGALRAAGHAIEDRPYRPHVTLARCPNGFPRERLERFLGGDASGSFPVEAFGLYSSRPGDRGPEYRLEREYALEPGGAA